MSLIDWKVAPKPTFKVEDLDPTLTFQILKKPQHTWVGEVKRDKSKGKAQWLPYIKLSGSSPTANITIHIGSSRFKKAIERGGKVPKNLILLSMNGTAEMTPAFMYEMHLATQYAMAVYEHEIKNIDNWKESA